MIEAKMIEAKMIEANQQMDTGGKCGRKEKEQAVYNPGMPGKKSAASVVTMNAMLIALALIFSYVEALLPINFGIPGIKLGLANLAIVAAIYLVGAKQAFVISAARIILAGFLFGNLMSIGYSLAGGMLSLLLMVVLIRYAKLSVIAVSVVGGVMHNVGQILLAMLVVENLNLIYYLPILMIAGVITGCLMGIIARAILPYLYRISRKGN